MAISTANNTFLDFLLRLLATLGVANTSRFVALHVIEIKGPRVIETTIHTPGRCLVLADPRPKFCGTASLIFSITRSTICFGSFVISASVFRVIATVSRPAICLLDLIWIAFTPAAIRFSMTLALLLNIHDEIVACDNLRCKPDIFEETYDPVE